MTAISIAVSGIVLSIFTRCLRVANEIDFSLVDSLWVFFSIFVQQGDIVEIEWKREKESRPGCIKTPILVKSALTVSPLPIKVTDTPCQDFRAFLTKNLGDLMYRTPKEKIFDTERKTPLQILSALLIGALAGLPMQPRSWTCRVMIALWWLASITLMANFTGRLVALFAVDRISMPFNGIPSFSTYKLSIRLSLPMSICC